MHVMKKGINKIFFMNYSSDQSSYFYIKQTCKIYYPSWVFVYIQMLIYLSYILLPCWICTGSEVDGCSFGSHGWSDMFIRHRGRTHHILHLLKNGYVPYEIPVWEASCMSVNKKPLNKWNRRCTYVYKDQILLTYIVFIIFSWQLDN